MDIFCRLVGLLFLLDLLAFLPFFPVFFGKGEHHGNRPDRALSAVVALAWLSSTIGLMVGGPLWRWLGTGVLYAVFRHYYIDSRWSSIRRGGGAPGFMAHWTLLLLLLVQVCSYLDASGKLATQALHLMRVDFAWIMICAGAYKVLIGYLKNDGMEYGRANPCWGYHWRRYRDSDPASLHVRVLNALGSLVEIAAGALMLVPIPGLQALAALSITLGFVYVAAFIRLGRLAFLMMLLPAIFVIDPLRVPFHLATPAPLLAALGALMQAYIWLLPLVKCTQYSNLFLGRRLPQPWQNWLTAYANAVPIIIWRVFTPDVTNFFVRIYEQNGASESPLVHESSTYSYAAWDRPALQFRFLHVTESIALISVFTTLKYFPSQPELFREKLLAYARSLDDTLGRPAGRLRFEYVAIVKQATCFAYIPVSSFFVEGDQVWEQKLRDDFDYTAASRFSPLQETRGPGSYEPAAV